MTSREKRRRALENGPDRPIDRRNRWAHATHRGTPVDFVSSGILVEAETPEQLAQKTDEEIARRTSGERKN